MELRPPVKRMMTIPFLPSNRERIVTPLLGIPIMKTIIALPISPETIIHYSTPTIREQTMMTIPTRRALHTWRPTDTIPTRHFLRHHMETPQQRLIVTWTTIAISTHLRRKAVILTLAMMMTNRIFQCIKWRKSTPQSPQNQLTSCRTCRHCDRLAKRNGSKHTGGSIIKPASMNGLKGIGVLDLPFPA